MKTLWAVLITVAIGVALAVAAFVLFVVYVVHINLWPTQAAMVSSAYPMIPEAKQIDDLFGPAWHRVCNYKQPDIVEWQSNARFAGRYDLTMVLAVKVDRRTGKATKVLDEPRFLFQPVTSISLTPDGKVGTISYGESRWFSLAEWQKVVEVKGDFSVIGIHLTSGKPVANFDVYRNTPLNGIRMTLKSGKNNP